MCKELLLCTQGFSISTKGSAKKKKSFLIIKYLFKHIALSTPNDFVNFRFCFSDFRLRQSIYRDINAKKKTSVNECQTIVNWNIEEDNRANMNEQLTTKDFKWKAFFSCKVFLFHQTFSIADKTEKNFLWKNFCFSISTRSKITLKKEAFADVKLWN